MSPRNLGLSTLTVLHSVYGGCRYGFDVIDATGLQSGTVYRALSKLEERGLLRSQWEPAGDALREKRPRRKYYEVTPNGEAELAVSREQLLTLAKLAGIGGDQQVRPKES
jgi:DNA-binding PadR family transcriptional regulator